MSAGLVVGTDQLAQAIAKGPGDLSRGYIEAFFRHKYLLCLPIVVGLLVGAGLAMRVEREYVAHATFWADTPVPQESTNGTTGGSSPPSAGESTLLTQMLATRTFMRSVVEASPLAVKFDALKGSGEPGQVAADHMLGSVGGTIAVGVSGPQLVSITVTRHDPAEATGLADSVLDQFERAKMDLAVNRAKAEVNYNQRALEAAQNAAKESDDENAADRLADAQTSLDEANLNLIAAESTGLQIVDHPDLALPQARMKTIAFGGIGGMLAGLTLSLMALILLMARDRSLRNERDAARALNLDVVGSVPNATWKRRFRSAPSRDETQQLVRVGS